MTDFVISAEQEKELKETFDIFDEERAGCVPASRIGLLLRNAGETPTEARVLQFQKSVNERNGTVDFDQFIEMVQELRKTEKRLTTKDLEDAFRVFDPKKTGKIDAQELTKVLTTMGEKLSKDELEAVLKSVGVASTGEIDYVALSRKLLP